MNKHLVVRKHISTILVAGVLGTFTFVTPHIASAQNTAEKIQLMAEALRARDSGDLVLAKTKAEELKEIAPDDENASRLLNSINEEIDDQGEQIDQDVATVATVNSVDSVVATAVADQNAKIEMARAAITEAIKLAELGAYENGLMLLDLKSSGLTLNTTTEAIFAEIDQAKDSIMEMQATISVIEENPYSL
ncbi:MAG: hypothetical protein ACJAUA_000994, partial [Zhongshania aliphaticivorans]